MGTTQNLDFYSFYLVGGILLTGLVSVFLYIQGGKFLMEVFQKDTPFATSTNNMLLVSFLLFNLGYVFLTANPNTEIRTGEQLFEKLIYRLGVLCFLLGAEHTMSLVALYVVRKRRANNVVLNKDSGATDDDLVSLPPNSAN